MKLFCMHDWLPWSDPVVTSNGGHKQQWRVCAHCNKAQLRTIGWDKQTSIADVLKAVMQSQRWRDIRNASEFDRKGGN